MRKITLITLITSISLISCTNTDSSGIITIDTHIDINVENFTDSINYTMNTDTKFNIPSMIEGGLDVAWLVVYTAQGELNEEGYTNAMDNAIAKFDAIDRLVYEYAPDKLEIALNSDDVRRIISNDKKVIMIGVENAYPMGLDASNIEKFWERGARYVSLSHNGHSQLSDSNTGEFDIRHSQWFKFFWRKSSRAFKLLWNNDRYLTSFKRCNKTDD